MCIPRGKKMLPKTGRMPTFGRTPRTPTKRKRDQTKISAKKESRNNTKIRYARRRITQARIKEEEARKKYYRERGWL